MVCEKLAQQAFFSHGPDHFGHHTLPAIMNGLHSLNPTSEYTPPRPPALSDYFVSACFWHRQDWVGSTEGMSYSSILGELLEAK